MNLLELYSKVHEQSPTGKVHRKSWPEKTWVEKEEDGELYYFWLDPVTGKAKSRLYPINPEVMKDDWELYYYDCYYDQPIRDNSIKEGRPMKYVMLFAIIFSLIMLFYSVNMLSIKVEDLNSKIDKIVIFLDLNAKEVNK